MVNFNLNEEAPSDTYHTVIQPTLTVTDECENV